MWFATVEIDELAGLEEGAGSAIYLPDSLYCRGNVDMIALMNSISLCYFDIIG